MSAMIGRGNCQLWLDALCVLCSECYVTVADEVDSWCRRWRAFLLFCEKTGRPRTSLWNRVRPFLTVKKWKRKRNRWKWKWLTSNMIHRDDRHRHRWLKIEVGRSCSGVVRRAIRPSLSLTDHILNMNYLWIIESYNFVMTYSEIQLLLNDRKYHKERNGRSGFERRKSRKAKEEEYWLSRNRQKPSSWSSDLGHRWHNCRYSSKP